MQPVAGGAAARPFVTHHNALDMDLFLRIAPELYLKRLVVGGMERVYELSRNFRNEGVSTQHNPEFTMLEFYQAYADYQDLMAMTEEMLIAVARAATGRDEFEFNGHTISFTAPFRRLVLRQAAAEEAARRLGDAVTEADLRDAEKARGIAARIGLELEASTTAGKAATAIFEALWEDQLVQPTFVHDFPTEVSPLSKQRPDDPDTVERFELYVGGFEVANAFSELNDPAGAAPALRTAARGADEGRRRGARDGRGLRPCARVRSAADRGRGHRRRSSGHGADGQPVDSGRDPVSAYAKERGRVGARIRGQGPERVASADLTPDPWS